MPDQPLLLGTKWHSKQRCHRHNGVLGKISVARAYLKGSDETLSDQDRRTLQDIQYKLDLLEYGVRQYRREEDGTITHIAYSPESATRIKRLRELLGL